MGELTAAAQCEQTRVAGSQSGSQNPSRSGSGRTGSPGTYCTSRSYNAKWRGPSKEADLDSFVFIARKNVQHFRDRLRSEADPATRATLQKLLVQEEDKLTADLALVDDLEREISRCDAIIERQEALVVRLNSNGSDEATARTLLGALAETKTIHQQYRERVAIRIANSRV
jgi:hypothetical protein